MVASTNIEAIRELVKDESANEYYVASFKDYKAAILAAQRIADAEQINVYVREVGRNFAVWLKRGYRTDMTVRPSALSRRPQVDAKALEESAELDEKFRIKLQSSAWDILRAEDPEEALNQILSSVDAERRSAVYAEYEKLRKEVSDANTEDEITYATNDELRHYYITKKVGKPELPEWKAPSRLAPETWRRLANEGKVSLGSMKSAVNAAIERITRTGRAATWSVSTRPALCTIAKHIRRGDWWCLENMTPGELDGDLWHIVETIHYNPSARMPEHRFWRQPLEQRVQSVSWSVEISTYDGHLINRTVSAATGYSAEQKMRGILAEAGLGGFEVTDVRQADADSFDSIDLTVLEQGTLDHFEEEFEADLDFMDQLS